MELHGIAVLPFLVACQAMYGTCPAAALFWIVDVVSEMFHVR